MDKRLRVLQVLTLRSTYLSRATRDVSPSRWNSVSNQDLFFRATEALRLNLQNAEAELFLRAALPVLLGRIERDSSAVCRASSGTLTTAPAYYTMTSLEGEAIAAEFLGGTINSASECGNVIRYRWNIPLVSCLLDRTANRPTQSMNVPARKHADVMDSAGPERLASPGSDLSHWCRDIPSERD